MRDDEIWGRVRGSREEIHGICTRWSLDVENISQVEVHVEKRVGRPSGSAMGRARCPDLFHVLFGLVLVRHLSGFSLLHSATCVVIQAKAASREQQKEQVKRESISSGLIPAP